MNSASVIMFCADYLAAFAFHWGINHQMGQTENKHFKLFAKYPFLHGAVSGFFGALAIYPMDFVRHEIMKSRNILYNMSTVPYGKNSCTLYYFIVPELCLLFSHGFLWLILLHERQELNKISNVLGNSFSRFGSLSRSTI